MATGTEQYLDLTLHLGVIVLVTIVLWLLIEVVALILKRLPTHQLPYLRYGILRLQENAVLSLSILFSIAMLGFAIGYSASNSRESVIGSVVTTAITALSGVVAYWFAKDSSQKSLSALSVAAFSVALLFGGVSGGQTRVVTEVDQLQWELYKLERTSQINVMEYGQKAVIDINKELIHSALISSTDIVSTLTSLNLTSTLPITDLIGTVPPIPTPQTSGSGGNSGKK